VLSPLQPPPLLLLLLLRLLLAFVRGIRVGREEILDLQE